MKLVLKIVSNNSQKLHFVAQLIDTFVCQREILYTFGTERIKFEIIVLDNAMKIQLSE